MANPLTDEQLKQIRAKVARRMNWDSMPDIWRWRWAMFLSEEPLERKFFAILMSCYPNFGKGISPEIEELAAIGGRQPRSVINHTTELHTKGYVPRESGGGRGITSSYELAIPTKAAKRARSDARNRDRARGGN
jgi:hypothetical protein